MKHILSSARKQNMCSLDASQVVYKHRYRYNVIIKVTNFLRFN